MHTDADMMTKDIGSQDKGGSDMRTVERCKIGFKKIE